MYAIRSYYALLLVFLVYASVQLFSGLLCVLTAIGLFELYTMRNNFV